MKFRTFVNADGDVVWEMDSDAIGYLTQALDLLEESPPGTLFAIPQIGEINHILLRGAE